MLSDDLRKFKNSSITDKEFLMKVAEAIIEIKEGDSFSTADLDEKIEKLQSQIDNLSNDIVNLHG